MAETQNETLTNAMIAFAKATKEFGKLDAIHVRTPLKIDPPFPLGGSLTEYFSILDLQGQAGTGGYMHLTIDALDHLPEAQKGWRWITDRNGKLVGNEDWPKNWIVIADRNGDAVAVDSNSGIVNGAIRRARFQMADQLSQFIQAVGECMTTEKEAFNYEVMDDDFNPLPAFLDAANRIAGKHVGSANARGFMKFFFG